MEFRLLISWPWKRRVILCYSDWPIAITVVLKSGGGGRKRGVRERDMMMEAQSERYYLADFEDGGGIHELVTVETSRRWEKPVNKFSPKLSEENAPWIQSSETHVGMPDPYYSTIIDLCCFKLLTLQSPVISQQNTNTVENEYALSGYKGSE